jgi:hypothetical protein
MLPLRVEVGKVLGRYLPKQLGVSSRDLELDQSQTSARIFILLSSRPSSAPSSSQQPRLLQQPNSVFHLRHAPSSQSLSHYHLCACHPTSIAASSLHFFWLRVAISASSLKANTHQVQSQQAILSIAARTPIDLLSIVFCLVPADPSDSIRHPTLHLSTHSINPPKCLESSISLSMRSSPLTSAPSFEARDVDAVALPSPVAPLLWLPPLEASRRMQSRPKGP